MNLNEGFQNSINKNLYAIFKVIEFDFFNERFDEFRFFHTKAYEVKYGFATGLLCHYVTNDP